MPAVETLRIYPIKGLDGIEVGSAALTTGGTLAADREFALFDDDGDLINGKRTPRVHEIRTDFDPETYEIELRANGNGERFDLETEAGRKATLSWLSEFFGMELQFERDRALGYVDRRDMGPSVISTATLETVASWFEDVSVEGARRRLRANIEVSGVEAFWEDRFVGADSPGFSIGDTQFEGVTPCGRCVVPQRDPDTGEETDRFRERFVEKRRETFPSWADPGAFDHYYTVMLIAAVTENSAGERIEVGDRVAIERANRQ